MGRSGEPEKGLEMDGLIFIILLCPTQKLLISQTGRRPCHLAPDIWTPHIAPRPLEGHPGTLIEGGMAFRIYLKEHF